MKLVSTLIAGALALGTTASLEAAPRRGPRPAAGHVARPRPRPAVRAAHKRPLRVMSATAFATEAKPGAAALLGQLRTGIRITGVEALGSDAVTGCGAVLAKLAAMLGGDPRGITLRVLADHQVIVKISRHAGAAPTASSDAKADDGEPDDEAADDAEADE